MEGELDLFFFFFHFSSVITWLNKQLNEVQMTKKMDTPTSTHGGARTAISPHGMVRYKYK